MEELMDNARSRLFLWCDIGDERIERETDEAAWFYVKPELEELIDKCLKLVVSAWRQRRNNGARGV